MQHILAQCYLDTNLRFFGIAAHLGVIIIVFIFITGHFSGLDRANGMCVCLCIRIPDSNF